MNFFRVCAHADDMKQLGSVLIWIFIISGVALFLFLNWNQKRKNSIITQNDLSAHKASYSAKLIHVNGLPLAENVICMIYSCTDHYEFVSGSMHFNLSKEKVKDMCVKTEDEIQKQYVSSIGGAIAGEMVFGKLGAIIGGRAKQKTIHNVSRYLIITYMNDDEVKYIGFDATQNPSECTNIILEFRRTRPQEVTNIEL